MCCFHNLSSVISLQYTIIIRGSFRLIYSFALKRWSKSHPPWSNYDEPRQSDSESEGPQRDGPKDPHKRKGMKLASSTSVASVTWNDETVLSPSPPDKAPRWCWEGVNYKLVHLILQSQLREYLSKYCLLKYFYNFIFDINILKYSFIYLIISK